MNPWQILDVLIVGWHPLSIDGTFPIELTRRRILDLNSESTNTALPIRATVENDLVEVGYLADPSSPEMSSPGRSGIVHFIRPVFRGLLFTDESVKLVGAFGGGWIVRLLGVTAIVVVALILSGFAFPAVGNIGLRLWAMPLAFLVACIVTRINAGDDMRLIVNNLNYALRGDES